MLIAGRDSLLKRKIFIFTNTDVLNNFYQPNSIAILIK